MKNKIKLIQEVEPNPKFRRMIWFDSNPENQFHQEKLLAIFNEVKYSISIEDFNKFLSTNQGLKYYIFTSGSLIQKLMEEANLN